MKNLLRRASMRHLLRYRWQTLLSILGVALGVAVVVAVDLANESSRRAFHLSMDAVTGKTTHHIIGDPTGFDDSHYRRLRIGQGIRQSAPVVEGFVAIQGETFRLLGVDPFAERDFRTQLGGMDAEALRQLIVQPETVAMSRVDAERLGLAVGDPIALDIEGRLKEVRIVGLLGDGSHQVALDGLLMADIATAQELFGRVGRLDRIDLILHSLSRAESIRRWLPSGLTLIASRARSDAAEQMVRAFRINLTAMSLLALLVGAFLIYNTMSFSVLRRRKLLATLRMLGVTRGEIFRMVLFEAALIALVGTALGVLLGIGLGEGLVRLVTRTINDLYFVLTVTDLLITPLSLLKGSALGIGAAVIAALIPAREAAGAPPQAAISRSFKEQRVRASLPKFTTTGLLLMTAALVLLAIPTRSILVGYMALFLMVAGFSFLVPLFVVAISAAAARPFRKAFGPVGHLAAQGVGAELSRSGVAIAALAVAVSSTVGVGVMVGSFRATVVEWLDQTLESDVYISTPHSVSSRTDGTLDPQVVGRVREISGVGALTLRRRVSVSSAHGDTTLLAVGLPSPVEGPPLKAGRFTEIWPAFRRGDIVLISEPFAYRSGLRTGDHISLLTKGGRRSFPIGGIFYYYGSDPRLVMMSRGLYERLWDDFGLSSIGLLLQPGASDEAVMDTVRERLRDLPQQVLIRSNREIRSLSLDIFDRTFLITQVLRLLAVGVAFVGVLSALMALQLERSKEHAVLRATGITPGELFGLVGLQTALMGIIAGALAIPLGLATAEILIHVINKRSFGWSLQTLIPLDVLGEAVVLAVVAALLAGLYPAIRMARVSPGQALQEE